MEEHNYAWKLILRDKDFSLVDKLNHPKYRDTDNLFGVDMNLENDKSTLFDYITFFCYSLVSIFMKMKSSYIMNNTKDMKIQMFLC